jgi:hypothetical protein
MASVLRFSKLGMAILNVPTRLFQNHRVRDPCALSPSGKLSLSKPYTIRNMSGEESALLTMIPKIYAALTHVAGCRPKKDRRI